MTSQKQHQRDTFLTRWSLIAGVAGIVLLMAMAVYAADGNWLDGYFLPGLDYGVRDFCTYQGQLIAAGQFTAADGREYPGLARWEDSVWTLVGQVAYRGGAFSAVCEYNGELFAAGQVDTAEFGSTVNALMAYNGSDWRTVADQLGYYYVSAMYEYGGDLIIAGAFRTVGEDTVNHIVRYDGSAFHPLGDGLHSHASAEVHAVVEYEGQLVAGGRFYIDSTNGGVAYWNDPSWSILGEGIHLGIGWVEDLIVFNNTLYVCGLNLRVNDTLCCVATYDGFNWAVADSGLGPSAGRCREFAIADGRLYVGGLFYAPDSSEIAMAVLDGDVWSPLEPRIHPDGDGGVFALEAIGDTVYVGGEFFGAGTLAGNNVLRWDGAEYSRVYEWPVGLGCNGTIYQLIPEGGDLYALGDFTTIGGVVSYDIARFNGAEWESMTLNEYSTYMSALVRYDGDLYIGGAFYDLGPDSADKIARWDGANWRALPNLPTMNVVRSMIVHHDTLFVGTLSWGVYAWDGVQWSERLIEGGIYDLAVLNDTLYAGGVSLKPSDSDLVEYCGLARRVDGAWYSVGGSIEYLVTDLLADGDDLWVAGEFHEVGGDSAKSIAVWEGDGWNTLGGGPVGWGAPVPDIYSVARIGDNIAVCGQLYTVAGVDTCFNVAWWDGGTWSPMGRGTWWGQAHALTEYEGDVLVGGSFMWAGPYYSSGIARWTPVVTGIEIDNPPELPTGCKLLQNYPNPFNPSTKIEYALPRASHVTINILNVLGQTVRTLVDREQPAGAYTVEWDGKSSADRSVSTGVYFYRLKTDGFTETRKMVLLK